MEVTEIVPESKQELVKHVAKRRIYKVSSYLPTILVVLFVAILVSAVILLKKYKRFKYIKGTQMQEALYWYGIVGTIAMPPATMIMYLLYWLESIWKSSTYDLLLYLKMFEVEANQYIQGLKTVKAIPCCRCQLLPL